MMRYAQALAIVGSLMTAGLLPAQQGALGPPMVVPALGPLPVPAEQPAAVQLGPALGPPPAADGPAPPYALSPGVLGPPPGAYAPMAFPVPLAPRNPANPMMWGGVEALIWWTRGQPLPVPLITTGPASAGASAGNLGVPGTVSLNQPLNFGAIGGVRFFAGGWFDATHTFGMDGSIFWLGEQFTGFAAFDHSGTGALVINEPVAGAPFNTQVSAPGVDTGGASVSARSLFAGGDVNLLYNLYRADGWTVNLLGGYRFLELDESLRIRGDALLFTTTTFTDNAGNVIVTAPPGSSILVIDRFQTRNYFNGGQLGASVQYALNRWYFGGAFKLAMGATHEVVLIDGNTTVFPLNASPVPLAGGNFATLQIGRFTRNRFAVVPDLQLNVGYQITPWMRATLGYQFLFLSSVARPGNQIDNTFDGVAHPRVPMTGSSYWAQGINFGLLFTY